MHKFVIMPDLLENIYNLHNIKKKWEQKEFTLLETDMPKAGQT